MYVGCDCRCFHCDLVFFSGISDGVQKVYKLSVLLLSWGCSVSAHESCYVHCPYGEGIGDVLSAIIAHILFLEEIQVSSLFIAFFSLSAVPTWEPYYKVKRHASFIPHNLPFDLKPPKMENSLNQFCGFDRF